MPARPPVAACDEEGFNGGRGFGIGARMNDMRPSGFLVQESRRVGHMGKSVRKKAGRGVVETSGRAAVTL